MPAVHFFPDVTVFYQEISIFSKTCESGVYKCERRILQYPHRFQLPKSGMEKSDLWNVLFWPRLPIFSTSFPGNISNIPPFFRWISFKKRAPAFDCPLPVIFFQTTVNVVYFITS